MLACETACEEPAAAPGQGPNCRGLCPGNPRDVLLTAAPHSCRGSPQGTPLSVLSPGSPFPQGTPLSMVPGPHFPDSLPCSYGPGVMRLHDTVQHGGVPRGWRLCSHRRRQERRGQRQGGHRRSPGIWGPRGWLSPGTQALCPYQPVSSVPSLATGRTLSAVDAACPRRFIRTQGSQRHRKSTQLGATEML